MKVTVIDKKVKYQGKEYTKGNTIDVPNYVFEFLSTKGYVEKVKAKGDKDVVVS